MRTKMFKLTVVCLCTFICGPEQPLTVGAPSERAGDRKEPLFSAMPEYLRKDLLLYYSFDEPSSTKLIDLSGHNNDGKVHGVEYRPEGRYGAAGLFNGRDHYISIEDVHLEAFTFSAWIKTSTGGINNRRVFLFDSGEEPFFAVQGAIRGDMEFNTVILQEDEWEDGCVETDEIQLPENIWAHIAVSFDGIRAGIYFSGRLIQMKDLAREGFTGTLYIGGIEAHDGEFWHGMIDEVALFKRALFAAEIEYLCDPAEDNPFVELKSYCESGQAWSHKLLDILLRVASEMQEKNDIDPNLPCGRGIAHFYEIEKESKEKDKWEKEEEKRIIQFQFKGNSSRSDIFSGPKGKVKPLEWIFAENAEYGIRCDGDDITIEDNNIGIFHRELGYDMHPDTLNAIHGRKLSEFLSIFAKRAKEVGFRPSVTISDDGILQLSYVHTAPKEKDTLKVRMNISPPARILSLIETEEDYDKRRTKGYRQYRVDWQWHLGQCYVKNMEHIEEETEFDIDKNPEQPRHWYKHQKLEVLAYESRAAIPDRAFTVLGLDLKSDTDIRDRLKESEYSLDDVLQGRITPGPRYQSLMGTKLPSLSLFTNDTIDPFVRDKVVLICFFDMNQRPSRHYMTQLAKQAERIKDKEVILVAVQASKVEQAKLYEWIEENNISFPVGMIQNEEKKTRSDWGVKSIPWLILTDYENIVVAEGFMLSELDEKIVRADGGK
jgi:hypothetical protein